MPAFMSGGTGLSVAAGEAEAALLQHELAVFRLLGPRVKGVGESAYSGARLNKLDVHCRLDGKYLRRSGSAVFDSKLKCALEVRRWLTEALGAAAIDAAEELARPTSAGASGTAPPAAADADAELSGAELQWLRNWCDEHPSPEEIAFGDAEAALARHREAQCGAAALASLMETQRLMAKKRAAELRHSASGVALELAAQALQESKKARTAWHTAGPVPEQLRSGSKPPNWEQFGGYTWEKFRELEVKEQQRRAVEIVDHCQRECKVPRGDSSRGWLTHWRRGIGGALCSWAQGSVGAVVYMLARCAEHFEVQDDLAKELGLLPRAMTKKAETCIYIVGRVRSALDILKHCKSEAQRTDYHVMLGGCAPRRTPEDNDPDMMYARVAAELNVSRHRRCVLPALLARLPARAHSHL